MGVAGELVVVVYETGIACGRTSTIGCAVVDLVECATAVGFALGISTCCAYVVAIATNTNADDAMTVLPNMDQPVILKSRTAGKQLFTPLWKTQRAYVRC